MEKAAGTQREHSRTRTDSVVASTDYCRNNDMKQVLSNAKMNCGISDSGTQCTCLSGMFVTWFASGISHSLFRFAALARAPLWKLSVIDEGWCCVNVSRTRLCLAAYISVTRTRGLLPSLNFLHPNAFLIPSLSGSRQICRKGHCNCCDRRNRDWQE